MDGSLRSAELKNHNVLFHGAESLASSRLGWANVFGQATPLFLQPCLSIKAQLKSIQVKKAKEGV